MAPAKPRFSEDWLPVLPGLAIFVLTLGVFAGADLLGWAVITTVWTNPVKALGVASRAYAGLPGPLAFLGTYLFPAVLLGGGAILLGVPAVRSCAVLRPSSR
jgi:hypothetical protein